MCHGNRLRLAWVGAVGGRAGREGQQNSCCFVGAGEVVGRHVGGDLGWCFAVFAREGVVEGLEDPG